MKSFSRAIAHIIMYKTLLAGKKLLNKFSLTTVLYLGSERRYKAQQQQQFSQTSSVPSLVHVKRKTTVVFSVPENFLGLLDPGL